MKPRTNNININEYIAQAEAPTRFQAEVNELNRATDKLGEAKDTLRNTNSIAKRIAKDVEIANSNSERLVNYIIKAHSQPVPVAIKPESLQEAQDIYNTFLKSQEEILTTHEQRIKEIITKQEQNLDHIHLPATFFYIIIITLAMLLMGFGIIATLNATQIQNSTLTTYLWTITLATTAINTLTITTIRCLRRRE